jgi:hypothetical protein
MHRSITLKLLALTAILFTILSSYAQIEATFTHPAGEIAFGKSVALSGDWAIIGSPYNPGDNTPNRGKVYFYKRAANNQWQSLSTILCPDNQANSNFGYAVAIFGDWVIIGAPGVQYNLNSSIVTGAVYKYHFANNQWNYEGKLTNWWLNGDTGFGSSISMKDAYVAILAPDQLCVSEGSGKLYVYERNGDSWELINYPDCPEMLSEGEMYQQVAIDYPYCVIGTPNRHKIQVFNANSCTWVTNNTTNHYDSIGKNVAIEGNIVLSSSIASVHKYQIINNGLLELANLSDPSIPNGTFVKGVALNGIYSMISYSSDISQLSIIKSVGNAFEFNRISGIIPNTLCGSISLSDPRLIIGDNYHLTNIIKYKFKNVKITLTLDQGLTDIQNSAIKFTNLSNSNQYVCHPDLTGICNTPFSEDRFGTYRIDIQKNGFYTYKIDNVSITNDTDITYTVDLSPIGTDIYVSHTLNAAFRTIQEGIDYAFANQKSKVRILNDDPNYIYNENISVIAMPTTIPNFTLEGIGANVIIHGIMNADPQNLIHPIIFRNLIIQNSSWIFMRNIQHVTFDGCKIRGCTEDNAIYSAVPITFTNSEISNNSNSIYSATGGAVFLSNTSLHMEDCSIHNNAGAFGGGVHVNLGTSVSITNSTFENNQSTGDGGVDNAGTPAGAVYLKNCRNILIEGNQFHSNVTSGSSGPLEIAMRDTGYIGTDALFTLKDNIFIDNMAIPMGLIQYRGSIGPSFQGCILSTQDVFKNNIVTSVSSASDFIIVGNQCAGELDVNNCDFIMDTTGEGGAIIHTYSNLITKFDNCIFKTGVNDARFIAGDIPVTNLNNNVTYALFSQGYTTHNGTTAASHVTTHVSNMYLDNSYVPIWNANVKSPCIDNGEPGKPDADGTPADIGAITAIAHNYEQYAMWNDKSPDKINQGLKWMCFPVLDHYMTSNNFNVNFFDNILDTDVLEWIQYKPLLTNVVHPLQWNNATHNWGDYENEVVSSIQGYKVKLRDTVENQIWINTSGLLQSPQSVIDLQGDNDVHADNWIAYFCKDSADPLKALEAIIDNLNEIKTQYWCLTKQGDGSWIGEKNAVLNYGNMVILHGHTDCSFQWNNSEPVPPHDKKLPKEFIYTEKENYIPVYIRLYGSKSDEVPSEIGLYVNDVCKGAVAVTDSLAQICAYIDEDEEITPENSQLVFYYESKSTGNNMGIYHMNDKSFTYINGNTPYYVVSISDFNNVIPVVTETALSQNYPNPFNPSTTISYQIPNDGKVNLAIYNIRGQMVKCLVNTNQAVGIHRIVWNGKDENGKSCASGVYYYRLNTCDKTETKKMLLLK